MQQNSQQPPVSPELKQLQQPGQNSIRNFLRIAGVAVLLLGIICVAVGSALAFSGQMGMFWLAFVGMPMMFVGSVMCMGGFMGAVARFMAGETAPVGVDTAKYTAEETKGAVETVAKAAVKGVIEGIEAGRGQSGERKSDSDEKK